MDHGDPGNHDHMQELLSMYDQMNGEVPDGAPPELKGFFDSIAKSKEEARLKKQAPADGVEEIYPVPEFVVKTQDDTGRKVFVNMCSSDKIQAPTSWEGGLVPDEVKANLENLDNLSDEDAQKMRFPLSLTEARNDLDRNGEPCTVFDCALSTHIMKQVGTLRPLKVFVIEMALGWIQSKHKVVLDPRFKLPKLRYKGDTIVPQNIRKDKKALIEEMDSIDNVDDDDDVALPLRVKPIPKDHKLPLPGGDSKTPSSGPDSLRPLESTQGPESNGAAATVKDSQQQAGEMSYGAVAVSYDERPCETIVVSIELPGDRKWVAEDISVRAGCDAIHVTAQGCGPRVVPLNVYIRPDSVRSIVRGSVLQITAAYQLIGDLLAYMHSSRPLPVGAIKLQSKTLMDELD